MSRDRDRLSLAARSQLMRSTPQGPTSARERPPGKHCWVADAPGHPGRWPGLLVEWRRGAAGWEGRVTYVVTLGDRSQLVEQWLSAAFLESP